MATTKKYINPYTDFGFKKLFGEEVNKDLLIDFLNQLLPKKHLIDNLTFKNVENQNDLPTDRKAIFDIHCETANGEKFIVEMQKAKIQYFKDRALFYTTFPIKEQAEKGDWNFRLTPIYFIAILDFFYDEEEEKAKIRRNVQLKDQDCEVFYEKLNYVFLQMPAFKKTKEELKTKYDKWLYFLKNLENFNDIPEILNEPIFNKAFKIAEIANFSQKEHLAYQKSLISYLDMVNVMKTKFQEGKEEGRIEGKKEGKEEGIEFVAIKCIEQGMSFSQISLITGLTEKQLIIIKEKKS